MTGEPDPVPQPETDRPTAGSRPPAAAPGRVSRWLGGVVLAVFAVRLLTPPVGGIITSDSVGYLSRSFHPLSYGLVVQGYRQTAYSVWIHVLGWLGGPIGLDAVFSVALVQRLMLLAGIVLMWGALRWWSVPLLVVVTSATFVINTDYILMEGFLIPTALITAALAASVVTGRGIGARHPRAALVAVTVLAVAMGLAKLQYSVALLLACAVAWLAFRDRALTLRFALVTLSVAGVLVGGLAIGQTVENHRELGTWEPVGERARAEFYGAYEAVFVVHPGNRKRPQLAPFYDDGDLYVFLHGLEEREPDYTVRQAALRQRVDEMFVAARTTKTRQQAAAFLGALQGGRTDDIVGVTNKVWREGVDGMRARLAATSRNPGAARTLVAATDGRETKIVTIEGATSPLQAVLDDYRSARGLLGLAGLALALAALAVPGRHRAFLLASTLSMLFVSAVLGSAYIDNARYLISPTVILLVGATLGARALGSAIGAVWRDRGLRRRPAEDAAEATAPV